MQKKITAIAVLQIIYKAQIFLKHCLGFGNCQMRFYRDLRVKRGRRNWIPHFNRELSATVGVTDYSFRTAVYSRRMTVLSAHLFVKRICQSLQFFVIHGSKGMSVFKQTVSGGTGLFARQALLVLEN